jgi:prevent-host-death family protein
MESKTVTLATAKAHLSELTELAAAGETIIITKRGKPVVKVTQPDKPRKPIKLETLRSLAASLPRSHEDASDFARRMRDNARY